MRFGNSWKYVALMTLVGAVLGILTFVCAILCSSTEERLRRIDSWLLLPVIPTVPLFLIGALTALLRVRVADGKVQHVFLNWFVISEAAVADYEGMKWMVGLRFKHNKVMRPLMHEAEFRRLEKYLAELAGTGKDLRGT